MSTPRRPDGRTIAGAVVVVAVVAITGPGAVRDGIASLELRTLALGVLLGVPATVACAWRWRVVARRLGGRLDLGPAVAACYASQFLNTTLPGGVLGDVHRGLRQGRAHGSAARGLATVAWERLAGQVVLVAVTFVAVVTAPWSPSSPPAAAGGVLALLAVALVVTVVLPDRPAWWTRLRATVRGDARLMRDRQVWPAVVLASLVAIGCHVATYLVVASAVGVTASPQVLLPLVLLVFVAAALPTNVAGWGPREGMAAATFAMAGLGSAQGLATGVAFGVVVLVASLPGAVVLAADLRRVGPEGSRTGA